MSRQKPTEIFAVTFGERSNHSFSVYFMKDFVQTSVILLSLRLEEEDILKYRCVCRSRAEKFNIVSNDHGRPHKCDISVSDRKYHFWAHLAQKIKFNSLSWNLVPRLIQISRIQWWYSLVFVSDWNSPFWSNLVQKNKIFSFSWSLLSGLIRICRIQWWYSRFLL